MAKSSKKEVLKKEAPSSSEDDLCQICLSKRENTSCPEPCLHKFCHECITRWSRQSNKCPICRQEYSNLRINYKADGTFELYNVPPPVRPIHSILDDLQLDPILHHALTDLQLNPGEVISIRSGSTLLTLRGPLGPPINPQSNGFEVTFIPDREISNLIRQQLMQPLNDNHFLLDEMFERQRGGRRRRRRRPDDPPEEGQR